MSQQEWQLGVQDEDDFILGRRYDVLGKFHNQEYQQDHGFVKEMVGKGEIIKDNNYQSNEFSPPPRFNHEICAREWYRSTYGV